MPTPQERDAMGLDLPKPISEEVLAAMDRLSASSEAFAALKSDVFNPAESNLEYARRRARELGVPVTGRLA